VTTVNSGETTLSRATRVLEVFGPEASSLTASDISRRTGIPMASTHRLVGQMVQLGCCSPPLSRFEGMAIG
jgi:DNA-binding IclR family transcriptional regulator